IVFATDHKGDPYHTCQHIVQASRLLYDGSPPDPLNRHGSCLFNGSSVDDRFDVCGVLEESRTEHRPAPDSFFLHEASSVDCLFDSDEAHVNFVFDSDKG
ncbi:unnamed protein product, partial [Brassica rapa subsp. trilocularis]